MQYLLLMKSQHISQAEKNKACGLYYIRNEFLKNVPCSLIHFICDLFNSILDSAIIPDVWCQGLIMPLYKNKGSRYEPNNYRGITLLSCLGKFFKSFLKTRIANFMYANEKVGYEQAGFRPEFSTIDHIFTLYAIIEYYKSKNSSVLCFCWLSKSVWPS